MKKAMALLLALVMVFALFGCGSKEASASQTEVPAASKSETADASKEVDVLSVEGVSFEPYTQDYYDMNICVRNNSFPVLEGRELVDVVVYFSLLDASGNGIPLNRSEIDSFSDFPNLLPGQSCWTAQINHIDKAAVDAADTVQFTAYEFRYGPDETGEWKQIKGTLSEPVSFKIADLIPVGEEAFTVENLSVEFTSSLPSDIPGLDAFYPDATELTEELRSGLSDSEVYADIHFTITNLMKTAVVLNDLHGDFMIELNYDDGYIFSTDSSKVSVMKSGSKSSSMFHISETRTKRLGDEITLPPLSSLDVELFLRCAKVVSTQKDKSLVVSFMTSEAGYSKLEVNVR